MHAALSDRDFAGFRQLLHARAGIRLSADKKQLVSGRLARRIGERGVKGYGEYLALITGEDAAELQVAIDLLTTNETYFFREPKHFGFLGEQAAARARAGAFRVWSAACSSGEEAYSAAMVLAERLGTQPWEVVGTDLSTRVLAQARSAHYPDTRTSGIPDALRRAWCLKGTGARAGTLLVQRALRERVSFRQANLISLPGDLGSFDVVFLRNVMIYFDDAVRRRVLEGVVRHLRPGGYLFTGHAESIAGLGANLDAVAPAIHRKP